MNNFQDPRQSKCWTCKHGLCMRGSERHIFEPEIDHDEDEEPNIPFMNVEKERLHEQIVSVSQTVGLCYWGNHGKSLPLRVGFVEDCNRFETDAPIK